MNIIKKIRIKNFKSLEDVEIEMKSLPFLFERNVSEICELDCKFITVKTIILIYPCEVI